MPRWAPDLENGWHGNPGGEHVVRGDVHHRVGGVVGDVAERAVAPVELIDLRGLRVDLDRVDALAAERGQGGGEPADAGEEVDEAERRLSGHASS